jgi:glycosyltransferase involved in cell wall biosynthesis
MTRAGAPPLGGRVEGEPIYQTRAGFAPGLRSNALAFARLLRGDPLDIWHFVFAPNPVSSAAAMAARRAQRFSGWNGKVVQTIASAPRHFQGVSRWLFGDRIVVLSEWTRGRLVGAGVPSRNLRLIPPCAPAPTSRAPDIVANLRAVLGAQGPLIVYPGDYEFSTGSSTFARAIPRIAEKLPDARFVFACRKKTPRADAVEAAIKTELGPRRSLTHHLGEVEDMQALLEAADVVAFPVDDLYAKVDVPIVLLEALALGRPMVLARGGPLESIETASFVDPQDAEGLAHAIVDTVKNPARTRAQTERGRQLYAAKFTPQAVAAAHDDLYDELWQR